MKKPVLSIDEREPKEAQEKAKSNDPKNGQITVIK